MPLPKSVQRDLERAEAITAAMALEGQPPAPEPAPPAPPLLEPPIVAQPVVPVTPVVAAVPGSSDADRAAYWEKRAQTVLGMMQTEVPQLRATVKTLETQIQTLTSQKQQEKPVAKPQVDPKDVEAFGSDMIDMVQRYAEQAYASIAAQVDGKLVTIENRVSALETGVSAVGNATAATQEQQFFAALDHFVPNWQAVNEDTRWLAWLAEVDPIYGQSRQVALDVARANFDATRTANIFKAFIAAIQPSPAQTLASQVAPTTSAAALPSTAPSTQKRIWTQKEFGAFYNDLARGLYRGREAEAQAFEAELNLAASEHRIR